MQFVVYDIDPQRIESCQRNEPPIFEHGLQAILAQVNGCNLSFTCSLEDALCDASIIFLALPTPTKQSGEHKGKAYDLSFTERATQSIIHFFNDHPMPAQVILVEKSTVPIGTARKIEETIRSVSLPAKAAQYSVVSNPEFLAEGTAVENLLRPDRVVIGASDPARIQSLLELYHFVAPAQVILTSQCSAELSKLAANCFLAQRVSSINSMAILCEEYPSDVSEVRRCLAADSRIGEKYLESSVGFGGSCFKKDIQALIYLAEAKGLEEVGSYWRAVLELNEYRKKSFFLRVLKAMHGTLKSKRVSVFGVAFKKDTNDARESCAVEICHYLLEEGATVHVHDPQTSLAAVRMSTQLVSEMRSHELWREHYGGLLKEAADVKEAVLGSQAILLLTDWAQFQHYDYRALYEWMDKPAFVFDGRRVLSRQQLEAVGFRYFAVGSPSSSEQSR